MPAYFRFLTLLSKILAQLFYQTNVCAESMQLDRQSGGLQTFRFAGLKVFIEEKVDVAILEVGLGGRLDATNIVPQPVVCGVSSLGFDHMELLGHTLSVSISNMQSITFLLRHEDGHAKAVPYWPATTPKHESRGLETPFI